jgi:hypothetical protein
VAEAVKETVEEAVLVTVDDGVAGLEAEAEADAEAEVEADGETTSSRRARPASPPDATGPAGKGVGPIRVRHGKRGTADDVGMTTATGEPTSTTTAEGGAATDPPPSSEAAARSGPLPAQRRSTHARRRRARRAGIVVIGARARARASRVESRMTGRKYENSISYYGGGAPRVRGCMGGRLMWPCARGRWEVLGGGGDPGRKVREMANRFRPA